MSDIDSTVTPRSIVVGVSGGIAAYKACHLIRNFKEYGDDVRVIPTKNALKFVGAATFEALSGNPVTTDVFDNVDEVQHVAVGQKADVVVVAPATADIIAKIAAGRADDFLTATILVATCPVIVAPAMHTEMWNNSATVDNVATLRRRGITVIEPAHGRLTGKDSGPGRLPEPAQIAELVRTELSGFKTPYNWQGKKVVISAGGTREYLDPVRFIGNLSSGRQGFAIAELAAQRGAEVVIVAGSTDDLPVPSGATVEKVETTAEMAAAMYNHAADADVVIMAAAVADYRPADAAEFKLKKGERSAELSTLELVENPDILATLVRMRADEELESGTIIVGFAAETGDGTTTALEYAKEKFQRKGCDVLLANEVGHGKVFGQLENSGWLLSKLESGQVNSVEVEAGSKQSVAAQILQLVDVKLGS